VTDDVDHRRLAQQPIRHALTVRVDVAVYQQPRLQCRDRLVQALEATVGQVLTIATVQRRRVCEQDVHVTAVAAA
jgi:DNA-directed RNA polymerase subunit H (RpoH/RPB5)